MGSFCTKKFQKITELCSRKFFLLIFLQFTPTCNLSYNFHTFHPRGVKNFPRTNKICIGSGVNFQTLYMPGNPHELIKKCHLACSASLISVGSNEPANFLLTYEL